MQRKNLLTLHEAIVLALIKEPTRTKSFEEIAKFIEQRNLYPIRKGNIPLATQIMLRSTKANGAYKHLFQEIGAGFICLRDTNANFPIQLNQALEALEIFNNEFLNPEAKTLKVIDIELGSNRTIKISAANVVCILTLEINNKKTGRKKFIYLQERGLDGKDVIGTYSIQESIVNLHTQIDPLGNHLVIVADNIIVNVGNYKLSKNKVLEPLLKHKKIISLPIIKFSESKAAKVYQEKFELIQKQYIKHTSLQKTILNHKNDMGLNS